MCNNLCDYNSGDGTGLCRRDVIVIESVRVTPSWRDGDTPSLTPVCLMQFIDGENILLEEYEMVMKGEW
jgi:hypothetical protein